MPDTAEQLVRQFMTTAQLVTNDDPLRGTSIHAVADTLGWQDWDQINDVVAIAAARGWVRTSGGAKPHSISITRAWRQQL